LTLYESDQRTIITKFNQEIESAVTSKRVIEFNNAGMVKHFKNAFFYKDFFHAAFSFEFLREHFFESKNLQGL
jgi:hypothetical protein